jgi:EAL domain-containing protein (putative c-di-GMP-specific phosphodiesterase class I)
MGLQTVAKRVMGGDHSNWLTALGVDFVQSFEASPPVALDSLLGLTPTKENAG